jgi:4-amino-4-deoxy-L-arabinose transferase-like glycosyltransferase
MPIHFIAFGDYPPPALRYLTILPVYFFGLSSLSVRFPSALFGTFSVILAFFLARKIFDKRVGLFSSLLFAVSPWAIGLSRVTIDPNTAMTFFLSGLLLYLLAKEKKIFLLFSVLSFAATVYAYSAYVLFLPLAGLTMVIWDRKYVFKNLKICLISFLLLILLVIPNFLIKNNAASVRFSQVGLISNVSSIGLINNLNDSRGACLKDFNSAICRISDNKIILYMSTFLKNYLSHFNFNWLYSDGNSTQFSVLPARGLGYIFEIAFFILGIIMIIKNKNRKGYFLIALLLVSPIPDSLTGEGHYGRASVMLPFMLMIEGAGLFCLVRLIGLIKYSIIRKLSYLAIFSTMVVAVTIFWITYLTYFKNYYSVFSQYGYEDLMKKVYVLRNSYDKIYISKNLNDTKQYVYYLFYNKYDPKKFQNKIDVSYRTGSDGWVSIDRINNIYFVQDLPIIDENLINSREKALFISSPVDFPKSVKPEFVVKDKVGNTLFAAELLANLIKYKQEHKNLPLISE